MKSRSALLLACALAAARLAADPLNCDLSGYQAQPGLSAAVAQDTLTIEWSGGGGEEMRARYAIDHGQPVVRELAVRREGRWTAVAENLTPEFWVQTGHRRIDYAGLAPLKLLGVDTSSKEVIEREAWVSFWDAPFVIPGETKRNPGTPRQASEIQQSAGILAAKSCRLKTDGQRLEIEFPDCLAMGIFSGGIRLTHYRGTGLFRVEAIAMTQHNLVAYKYAIDLKGVSTHALPRVRWLDTGGNPQQYRFGGAVHDGPVTVRAKNRVMVAEGPNGSLAVLPPPTVFFPAREVDTNLGYVWYRKDAPGSYSFGVKQADHEDDTRYLQNFAVYNAPPGTWQRMACYFILGAGDAWATRAQAMAFTHNDTFPAIPGYQTFVNHFHLSFVDRLRAAGSLNGEFPDLAAMRALGINMVGLSDFHADQLRAGDPGAGRFADQADYFEACRRASDTDFLILPWEEPSVAFGGHYNLMGPHPIYFSRRRLPNQPFTEQDPKYGKVYHTGTAETMQQMMEAEDAYWYTAHPRTKSSAGYPDAYWDKPFVKSDHYLGVAFKPGMGMDLSEDRLAAWRGFGSMDELNNRITGLGLRPKVIIGDVDTYQKWPHDDLFPGFTINYLKMDHTPGPDDSWADILHTLSRGDFFVSTGEILIRNYAVKGHGASRTIVADVDWTYPPEFVEVVWGDGQTTGRQVIRATGAAPLATQHLEIPFDATGKKWVRLAAWDSAVNGAAVQPVWLD